MKQTPLLAGIGILVGFTVSGFVLPLRTPPSPAFPAFPALGQSSPAPQPASPTEPAPPSPARSSPPPAVTGPTGEYALDELYDEVFIARVVVGNESGENAGWTVELAYGSEVGELRTFWVDGTIQPSLQRVDDRYVFTSAEDLDPAAAVALNVHFERSGSDISPATCLVNGAACVISQ